MKRLVFRTVSACISAVCQAGDFGVVAAVSLVLLGCAGGPPKKSKSSKATQQNKQRNMWPTRLSRPLPNEASKEKPTLLPNCKPLFSQLQKEETQLSDFRCEQRVDFDGDGKMDRAFLTSTDGADVLLAVALAGKKAMLVGTPSNPLWKTEYKEKGRTRAKSSGFRWIMGWRVYKREGNDLVSSRSGVRRRKVRVPDGKGQGLWMTSTDAAAIFYLSTHGWTLMHLGY